MYQFINRNAQQENVIKHVLLLLKFLMKSIEIILMKSLEKKWEFGSPHRSKFGLK